jgi:formylglycine-generating enzyme required for sulfatase activity
MHISWNDAMAYCAWAGYRLPTEAEWEFAGRAGLEQRTYPWGDEILPGGSHRCNIWQGAFPDLDLAEDGFSRPAPVRTSEPNGFGLYNMAGNAWEWCWDYAGTYPDAFQTDPHGPATDQGSGRVGRGGNWNFYATDCRNSYRYGNSPAYSASNIGFRCALSVP